jgi:UDP-glucuronate 4-epimerase
MRILVTGAAGFIGSHVSEALVARGHDVVGFDSFDGFLYPAIIKEQNARAVTERMVNKSFRLVKGDICDATQVAGVLTNDVDVVCHLAALAGVRPSLAEPLRYVHVNIHGTNLILERMRALGKKRFVFASSSSVYGVRDAGAFREDDPCLSPASPYATSKRAGELYCSTYRDLYGIGTSSLRFFTVYGPRQRPDMAIHKFVKAIAKEQPVTLFGDGSSRRDYTYIEDIVRGTVAACERIQPGAFHIYNLGGTQTTSLAELVALIEKTVGKRAKIERQPDQPGDVPITFADISNSKRDLDYAPTTDIDTGIRRFWEWWQTSSNPS